MCFFMMEKIDILFSHVVGSSDMIVTMIIATLLVLRVVYVLYEIGKPERPSAIKPRSALIVLGSGEVTNLKCIL